jgi:hypothetical protein
MRAGAPTDEAIDDVLREALQAHHCAAGDKRQLLTKNTWSKACDLAGCVALTPSSNALSVRMHSRSRRVVFTHPWRA